MKRERMAAIFNEWARRYADNPEQFTLDILDKDGRPVADYGEACAVYFEQLDGELPQ